MRPRPSILVGGDDGVFLRSQIIEVQDQLCHQTWWKSLRDLDSFQVNNTVSGRLAFHRVAATQHHCAPCTGVGILFSAGLGLLFCVHLVFPTHNWNVVNSNVTSLLF